MNRKLGPYINLPTPALKRVSRILLYTLITTLVFEGLVRKLVPNSVAGTIIFFFKDFICFIGLVFVYNQYSLPSIFSIKQKWAWISIALIPLLFFAFFIDPGLSLFAAKQYLLYTVVVLLTHYCFFDIKIEKIRNFLFYFSLLLLITTSVAMLQNSLPSTAWINLSVSGDSLEGFSAGGYLRVGSTFSFTGQYGWFLNVACPMTLAFFSVSAVTSKRVSVWQLLYWGVLVVAYIIGIFITGGRTAVLGAAAILGVGLFCLLLKRPMWVLTTGLVIISITYILLGALQEYKPEYFAAYAQRSSGSETQTHQQEVEERVGNSFTDWTIWFWKQDVSTILLGNGLGVMSNGSEQLSSFARNIKRSGFWTETDTATIFWEGGLYFALVWYLFRFSIVLVCFRIYWSIKEKRLNTGGAFLFAYIMVVGVSGTLGTQPPLSIWWWLSIGILLSIKSHEASIMKKPRRVFSKLPTLTENARLHLPMS